LVVLGDVVHGYWSKLEHQFGRLKLGQSLLRMPTLFDAVRVLSARFAAPERG
jgi:hypothetical protein